MVLLLLLLLLLVFLDSRPSLAQRFYLEQVGLRGGVSDNQFNEDFEQFEAFIKWGLPWRWQWPSGVHLDTRLDATAGILTGGHETGLVGSVGPSLALNIASGDILLLAGTGITLLSEDRFGREDFGGPIQFTSYAGLSVLLGRNSVAGYRYQHMSNAGIYDPNPGLNMHMFELAYHF